MAETLPTCQCVASQPPFDRLTSIYAVLRQLADDETLPSVQCVRAKSPYDRLTDIFCAALSWSGGGTIPELLGILNIADNSQILSFSRIEAAGFTGSGDPDRYQREAAVNVLRKSDFVGASNTDGPNMLIEDDPTLCVLIAPTNIVGTDNGNGTFNSTGTGIPITASLLRYDYRLDNAGVWAGNGASLTLTNISASVGSHVLNWRPVSTSGVAGDVATSDPFTVTNTAPVYTLLYDSVAGGGGAWPFSDNTAGDGQHKYGGQLSWSDSTPRKIGKISFILTKVLGDISGKTFQGQMQTQSGSDLATVVATANVTGDNSWNAMLVDFIFVTPFTTTGSVNYSFTCQTTEALGDALNYAALQNVGSSLIPGDLAWWRDTGVNQNDFGGFNVQMQIYTVSP